MATVKIEDSVYCSTHADRHCCACVDEHNQQTGGGERCHCRAREKQRCRKTHDLSIQLRLLSDRNLCDQIQLQCPHHVSNLITASTLSRAQIIPSYDEINLAVIETWPMPPPGWRESFLIQVTAWNSMRFQSQITSLKCIKVR